MTKKVKVATPDASGARFQSAVAALLAIAVILLVALWGLVHTRGFKSFLVESVEKRSGLRFEADSIGLGPPFDLVIRNGRTVNEEAGTIPYVQFKELRVGLLPLGLLSRRNGMLRRVKIDRATLSFCRSEAGEWQPRFFRALGEIGNAEDIVALSARWRKNLHLAIVGSGITWRNRSGMELAYTDGLDCRLTPIRLPHRRALHVRMSVNRIAFPKGSAKLPGLPSTAVESTPHLAMEWITLEDGTPFLIDVSGGWNGVREMNRHWQGGVR